MASRKTSYYDTYVDGNTVRTIETLPQEEPAVRRKKRRQAKVHSAVRYKQKTRTHALYAAFLTCIMGLLVFGCVRYLQIQSRVTASMENINKLESTLNDLKAENDAEYNRGHVFRGSGDSPQDCHRGTGHGVCGREPGCPV